MTQVGSNAYERVENLPTTSMILKVFLLLVILHSVTSDRLRFHLENLIDRNVSACDDFYHHVCSQKVDPKEFFKSRVEWIFRNASASFRPNALKNSPIAYDLDLIDRNVSAIMYENTIEDNQYETLVRERCKDDIECYISDQQYYAHFSGQGAQRTLINSEQSSSEIINQYIIDTSAMIDKLILQLNDSLVKEISENIRFHDVLQSRIQLIEFMKSNSTFGDFHEVKDIAEIMKTKMIENIEASMWLHGDEISEFISQKIKERIESIEIYHDFDGFDKNITTMLKLNRDLNHFYFANQRKTGILRLDTALRLNYACEMLKHENSPEINRFMERITLNFEFNAFFHPDFKIIIILAPFIYKQAFISEIFKEPLITYWTLAHELHHSLFSRGTPTLLALYDHRRECIVNHFEHSCSKFAMGGMISQSGRKVSLQGACMSGNKTITEDGADLGPYRLLLDLLRERYNDEQLTTKIDGLETNLEQAFFYYTASTWCLEDTDRTEERAKTDVHSAVNVRVNAALSLISEFTNAFGCKKGDPMYVEKKDSCYVFGPDSRF